MPDALAPLAIAAEARDLLEAKLIAMVLDGVTSLHSRRAYEKGLRQFFAWCREQYCEQGRDQPQPSFSKALANAYRSWLLAQGLAPSTINLRLSPIRKLAREMADNHLLAPDTAAAIERVPGVKQEGVRAGNWLLKEQASELLNAPNPATLKGKRDRAMLALLVGCGLRRAELLSLKVDQIEQREGRWVIPDLAGKGNRRRTVPVPAAVKIRVEEWILAAELDLDKRGGKPGGRLFRPISKAGKITGPYMKDEKGIWQMVVAYARQTSLLLGHASIQTTERYLGTVQNLAVAVNDDLGLRMD
jgi:site-specific recombinase XerD